MSERREINICPQYYQDRITHVGGRNRFDEPNFKLIWAQYETYVAGGEWSVDESYFKGYRRLLLGSGEPCWTLLQFHEAIEYGNPESYYVRNYDSDTGLQILGEYPYSGRYEVLYNLRWHEMVDSKLTVRTMHLNNTLIDTILPLLLMARSISWLKTKAAAEALKEQEETEKTRMIERHLQDKAPVFKGGVSYTRQGIRSTEIDRKMIEMQRTWNQVAKAASQLPKGMSTR